MTKPIIQAGTWQGRTWFVPPVVIPAVLAVGFLVLLLVG